MKQKTIAKKLKILTAIIGVVGLLVFGFMAKNVYEAYFALSKDGTWHPELIPEEFYFSASHIIPLLVVFVTMVLCYLILFRFYSVCSEIGKDNSFSLENIKNFSIMRNLLFIVSGIWFVYAISNLVITKGVALLLSGRFALYGVIFLTVAAFADALSKLVAHAYEIRTENELTI